MSLTGSSPRPASPSTRRDYSASADDDQNTASFGRTTNGALASSDSGTMRSKQNAGGRGGFDDTDETSSLLNTTLDTSSSKRAQSYHTSSNRAAGISKQRDSQQSNGDSCMGSTCRPVVSLCAHPLRLANKHKRTIFLAALVYLVIHSYLTLSSLGTPNQPKSNQETIHVYQSDDSDKYVELQPPKIGGGHAVSYPQCNNYSKNPNSDPSKQRLFFLKTHKTGSSTLQAIFFRKAVSSGKTTMLPRWDGKHTFQYPTPFAGYLADDKCYNDRNCQYLASHTVYSPKAEHIFPKKDSIYVSAVRDIPGMYLSLFRYCHNGVDGFRDHENSVNGFAEFARDPWSSYNVTYATPRRKRHLLWFFGRNALMYDFGFSEFSNDPDAAVNEERISEVVDILLARFDFLLLTERMDESLVLLADMMCWPLEDVVEFRQNIELNKDDKSVITDEMKANLIKFNRADRMLYEGAVRRFEKLKSAYGPQRLADDVKRLQEIRNNLIIECTVGGKPVGASQLKDKYHHILNPPGITIGGWKLNQHGENTELCRDLVSDELTWTDKVRNNMKDKGYVYAKKPVPKSVQDSLKRKAQESLRLAKAKLGRRDSGSRPRVRVNLKGSMRKQSRQKRSFRALSQLL